MAVTKLAGLFLCIVVAVSALPTQEEPRGNAIQTENDLLDAIYNDCLRKDSMSCLKYKLFNFVDKMLGHKDTITVTEGVQIVKTGGEKEGAPRAITSEDTIESLIYNRFTDFLENHMIKVNLKGSEIVDVVSSTARSLGDITDSFTEDDKTVGEEEGRGKKKKANKLMGPLMAAMALKAAILGKLALGAIALIAGKALLIGKIALVLSAIIGLKKLLGQGQGKHVTYEVVAHPQHSTSHVQSHEVYGGGSAHGGGFSGDVGGGYGGGGGSSGHGGWGRSLDAQSLAYRGQAQAQA
ncbi:keratin, type II cytoskeletal 1-like [Anoplophora glabripennis]|uniref:keratin, type II cytoskeletal 1-like n=1 Tax=Anoplophora glabripennis TaxID=217634 RepID=UPI0008750C29|nr:keratin, type II cytoskeletal 1-like [Anoplophora glabripennis]